MSEATLHPSNENSTTTYIIIAVGLLFLPLLLIGGLAAGNHALPNWDTVVDWRIILLEGVWSYYIAFIGTVLICIVFYIAAVRRRRIFLIGAVLQIGMLVLALFGWLVIDAHFEVRGTVENAGTTYHLVQAAPAANYRLDIYACEQDQCRGRTVFFADSIGIEDAVLTLDTQTGELVINAALMGTVKRELRIDPLDLAELSQPFQ